MRRADRTWNYLVRGRRKYRQIIGTDSFRSKWTTEGGNTGASGTGVPKALATHVKELTSVRCPACHRSLAMAIGYFAWALVS
jgi:hypothetical protein